MEIKTGITYPDGFLVSGISCGIKKNKKKDLALIYSTKPSVAGGCFTTNQFKSYSLLLTQKNIKNPIYAILINSGNANTCNGEENWKYTNLIIQKLGELLKIPPSSILMGSTGIIGKVLPYEKIISSLNTLVKNLSDKNSKKAAEAIMTTDTRKKEAEINTGIKGRKKEVVIGGMAKGAGMIYPNMATMLAFLTTDAVISQDALQMSLNEAIEDSFNMISIDNDQSTNDMVICLANGVAGNKTIHLDTPDYFKFSNAMKKICISLAKQIASDGEGAKKFIEVKVKGAWCSKDARRVAKKVVGSNLVKSAIAGGWPNWGRILSSIGSTNARINQRNIEIKLCGIPVYKGNPLHFSEKKIRKLLTKKEIFIEIDLKRGNSEATAWGCDLTEEYVKINRRE